MSSTRLTGAEKTLNTRIKLKYATYDQYLTACDTLILLQGEKLTVSIPPNTAVTGLALSSVARNITKTGNGTSTLSQLPWDSALISNTPHIDATSSDDDVVVLTGTGGEGIVSYTASHAKKGPSTTYTSGNTTTNISGSGSSILKIPQLTVDTYGHVTSAADESVTVTLPTETQLSKAASTASSRTLTYGDTFTAVTNLDVAGHKITQTAASFTLPAAPITINKVKTDSTWKTSNPVLADGELVFSKTSGGKIDSKLGNGTDTYNNLPLLDDFHETDKPCTAQYTYRATANHEDIRTGLAVINSIHGNTIVWNQKNYNGDFNSTDGYEVVNGALTATGNELTLTADSDNTAIKTKAHEESKLATVEGTSVLMQSAQTCALNIEQYGQCDVSGTPSTETPAIITGRVAGGTVYGKNLVDRTTNVVNGNHNGTTGDQAASASWLRESYYIPVAKNSTITISFNFTDNTQPTSFYIFQYKKDGAFLGCVSGATNTATIQLSALCEKIGYQIAYRDRRSISAEDVAFLQIEVNAIATAYEPYKEPLQYTVTDSNGQPVTLYGIPVTSGGNVTIDGQQYISDYIKDGICHRLVGNVELVTLAWEQWETSSIFYTTSIPKAYSDSSNISFDFMCTNYQAYITTRNQWLQTPDKYATANTANIGFYIHDNSYTDVDAFKTAMTGVYLYYLLATETTEPVTVSTVPAIAPTTTWMSEAYSKVSYKKNQMLVSGHKYAVSFDINPQVASASAHVDNYEGTNLFNFTTATANAWKRVSSLFTASVDSAGISIVHPSTSGNTVKFKNVEVFDLTKMFGAGNEPATVEDFKALFPKDYYEYDTGSLLSFNGNGIKTVGFNQLNLNRELGTLSGGALNTAERNFDEKKYYVGLTRNNYYNPSSISEYSVSNDKITVKSNNAWYGIGFPVRCFPNTSYYIMSAHSSGGHIGVACYDAEGNYLTDSVTSGTSVYTTTNDAYWLVVTFVPDSSNTLLEFTNNNINLSWSGIRNGEYEPYWTSTRNLNLSNFDVTVGGRVFSGMKSVGTACDEQTKDKDIRRIGVRVLTGNESGWNLGHCTTFNRVSCSGLLSDMIDTGNNRGIYGLCSHFEWRPNSTWATNGYGVDVNTRSGSTKEINFSISTSIDSLESWKSYLADQYNQNTPVTIYYPLLNPVETLHDPILNLSYQVSDFGTEEIMTADNAMTAPCNMNVVYGTTASTLNKTIAAITNGVENLQTRSVRNDIDQKLSNTITFGNTEHDNIVIDPDGTLKATTFEGNLNGGTNCYSTNTSDTAGHWNVTIPGVTELYDGLTIKVFLSTNYNGTYNTLNVNNLGDKLVWFRYDSRLTSHYQQYSILSLTYKSTTSSYAVPATPVTQLSGTVTSSGWIIENIFDSVNTYTVYEYNTRPYISAGSTLYRYMIVFSNLDKELVPATNTDYATTTKVLNPVSFDPFGPIYYYCSTTTVAAGSIIAVNSLQVANSGLSLSYSFNLGEGLISYKPVYIIANIIDTNKVTLAGISQTLPSAVDNKVYIYLGMAYSSTTIALSMHHPVYIYDSVYQQPIIYKPLSIATATNVGGIKSGADITVDSNGNVSVNDDSHNHVISNIDGLQTALDSKSDSTHTHASYINQNAFSNITVGTTTVSADTATDTLTLVAGSNITLTPDITNDKITIASTHPAHTSYASGLYKIAVDALGHVSSAVTVTKNDITNLGVPAADTNVTQAETTTSSYRPVILGYTYSETPGLNLTTSANNVVYTTNQIYAQPSTGLLSASKFNVSQKCTMQFNETTGCLEFIFS